MNRSGTVILSDDAAAAGKPFSDLLGVLSQRHLVIGTSMESTGWTFAEAIPLATFTATRTSSCATSIWP